MNTFREYVSQIDEPTINKEDDSFDKFIDEAMVDFSEILKKSGMKPFKLTHEPVDVKHKLFGSLCLAIGPELESGKKKLKKDQIDKIIELLESIKKDL